LFAAHLEASVLGADSLTLDDIARACWKGFEEGVISEADAAAISEAVEARRQILRGEIGTRKPPRPFLSQPRKPRSPDRAKSINRRRSWAYRCALPRQLANQFTPGETAVLSVVAVQCRERGQCDWPLDRIAAVAGVCRSLAKRAIRLAQRLGLVSIEERPRPGRKNATNVVRITSADWQTWLHRGEMRTPHDNHCSNSDRSRPSPGLKRARRYEQRAKLAPSYANTA
jgi:hypothetical protein